MASNNSQPCPLCQLEASDFHQDLRPHSLQRDYLRCHTCGLVFVQKRFHLSAEQEKEEYDKHQNNPLNQDYRRFLSRTFNPLMELVGATAKGLDFGCGPGPTISEMAREQGASVSNYDLYYFNNPALLSEKYDFITLTEVIEHIAQPAQLLELLDSMMKEKSILAIMTKRLLDHEAFVHWHYKNDPTHISFYSLQTFQRIEQQFNWRLAVIDKDVVFFHKE